jgi:hypothetical protein
MSHPNSQCLVSNWKWQQAIPPQDREQTLAVAPKPGNQAANEE